MWFSLLPSDVTLFPPPNLPLSASDSRLNGVPLCARTLPSTIPLQHSLTKSRIPFVCAFPQCLGLSISCPVSWQASACFLLWRTLELNRKGKAIASCHLLALSLFPSGRFFPSAVLTCVLSALSRERAIFKSSNQNVQLVQKNGGHAFTESQIYCDFGHIYLTASPFSGLDVKEWELPISRDWCKTSKKQSTTGNWFQQSTRTDIVKPGRDLINLCCLYTI